MGKISEAINRALDDPETAAKLHDVAGGVATVQEALKTDGARIAAIEYRPGDTIVVTFPGKVTDTLYARVCDRLREAFPDARVAFLVEGMTLGVAWKHDDTIEERLDTLERLVKAHVDHGEHVARRA